MKKVFTLLTLALMSIGSAWASGVGDLKSITSSVTFIMDGLNGTDALADKTLYADGQLISLGANGYSTSKGSTEYNSVTYKNVYQIKSNRQIALKIGFDAIITIVGQSNSSRTWRLGSTSAGNDFAESNVNDSILTAKVDGSSSPKVVYINASSDLYLGAIIITANNNTDPALSATTTSVNVKVTNSRLKPTALFTLSGSNLTAGETVNLSFASSVDGLSVSPSSVKVNEDGKVNAEITVSYESTVAVAASNVVLTAACGSKASCDVTINYSAVFNTLTAISEATTFELKETGATLDAVGPEDYVLLSDAGSEASFANNIAVKGIGTLNVTWRSDAVQAGFFKFMTTTPGSVTVKFSDTGSSDGRAPRYANVNGTRSDVYSNKSSDAVTCSPILVSAGDVIIKGEQQGEGDKYTDNQIRVFEIIFTPVSNVSITTAKEYTTYVSPLALDFSGIEGLEAYVATAASASSVTLEKVTQVPAGTPLILKGVVETMSVPVISSATAPTQNLLTAGPATLIGDGTEYILVDGKFYQANAGNLSAGKAYLKTNGNVSARLDIFFGNEATGISSVNNAQPDGAIYNLSGVRMKTDQKGIYIQNGKKIVR